MEQAYGYDLEQSRNEKIKTLGFLCYNLYIDGIIIFPEMHAMVESIKKSINYVLLLRKNIINEDYFKLQESGLNEKLVELGCFCYNLYIDRKLFNNDVLTLCNSISEVNQKITDTKFSKQGDNFNYNERCSGENVPKDSRSSGTAKQKLKINCPYGMEPIPANYKRCACGYRNRPEARFCGKCGARISA